jgi:microcystin-dependent protein
MSSFKDVHKRSLIQGGTSTPNLAIRGSASGVSNNGGFTTVGMNDSVVTVGNDAGDTTVNGATVVLGNNSTLLTVGNPNCTTMLIGTIVPADSGLDLSKGLIQIGTISTTGINVGNPGVVTQVRNLQSPDMVRASGGLRAPTVDSDASLSLGATSSGLNLGNPFKATTIAGSALSVTAPVMTVGSVNADAYESNGVVNVGTSSLKGVEIGNSNAGTRITNLTTVGSALYAANGVKTHVIDSNNDLDVGPAQSGALNIGTATGRSGAINVGTGTESSANINVGSTNTTTTLNGSTTTSGKLNASGGIDTTSVDNVSTLKVGESATNINVGGLTTFTTLNGYVAADSVTVENAIATNLTVTGSFTPTSVQSSSIDSSGNFVLGSSSTTIEIGGDDTVTTLNGFVAIDNLTAASSVASDLSVTGLCTASSVNTSSIDSSGNLVLGASSSTIGIGGIDTVTTLNGDVAINSLTIGTSVTSDLSVTGTFTASSVNTSSIDSSGNLVLGASSSTIGIGGIDTVTTLNGDVAIDDLTVGTSVVSNLSVTGTFTASSVQTSTIDSFDELVLGKSSTTIEIGGADTVTTLNGDVAIDDLTVGTSVVSNLSVTGTFTASNVQTSIIDSTGVLNVGSLTHGAVNIGADEGRTTDINIGTGATFLSSINIGSINSTTSLKGNVVAPSGFSTDSIEPVTSRNTITIAETAGYIFLGGLDSTVVINGRLETANAPTGSTSTPTSTDLSLPDLMTSATFISSGDIETRNSQFLIGVQGTNQAIKIGNATSTIYLGKGANVAAVIIDSSGVTVEEKLTAAVLKSFSIEPISSSEELDVAQLQTTGILNIGNHPSRTGDINLGSSGSTFRFNGSLTANGTTGSEGTVLTQSALGPKWADPSTIFNSGIMTNSISAIGKTISVGTTATMSGANVNIGNTGSTINIGGDVNLNELPLLSMLPPAGSIISFAGVSSPSGWLLCDGRSYSTTTYASLFGVVAYRYGGSGSSFCVPDLKNQFLRGASTTSTLSSSKLGAESVTISTSQLPSHTHSVNEHTHSMAEHQHWMESHNHTTADHTHFYADVAFMEAGGTLTASGGSIGSRSTDYDNKAYWRHRDGTVSAGIQYLITSEEKVTVNHNTRYTTNLGGGGSTGGATLTTQETGGGDALTILPPYVGINYIIKF